MGTMLCLLICESGYVSNDLSFSREDLHFMVGWEEGSIMEEWMECFSDTRMHNKHRENGETAQPTKTYTNTKSE